MKSQKLLTLAALNILTACSSTASPYAVQGIASPIQAVGYPQQEGGYPQQGIAFPQHTLEPVKIDNELLQQKQEESKNSAQQTAP
jgi:hypothetical protein